MEWQDIVSIIGMYVGAILCLLGAYFLARNIDGILYDRYKYCKNKKTIHIGFKWLFLRCKKNDPKEIFTIVFHELLSMIFFVAATALLAVSLLSENKFFILAGIGGAFLYVCWLCMLDSYFTGKKWEGE